MRDLAGLGREELPFDPDDIADIQPLERGIGFFADNILADIELDQPGLVHDLGKAALAHVAHDHEPTGATDGYAWVSASSLRNAPTAAAAMGRLKHGAIGIRPGRTQILKFARTDGNLVVGNI